MMLDPYYRTLKGFVVLIEKEWLSFGHKFGDRMAWSADGWRDEKERSPIFIQFLDCVHQCLVQSRDAYEFNEELLLFLASHAQSSAWFGNFLFNSEKERYEAHASFHLVSIWTHVLENAKKYTNVFYRKGRGRGGVGGATNDAEANVDEGEEGGLEGEGADASGVVIPVVTKQSIIVWQKHFLQWNERVWLASWLNDSQAADEEDGYQQQQDAEAVDGDLVGGGGGHDATKKHWVEDKHASMCRRCKKQFSFIRRKHHCRSCGQIFCGDCCSEFRIVPTVHPRTAQRVCLDCAFIFDEKDGGHRQDPGHGVD